MSKWYGSVSNRLEENKMFVDEITVGTGVTEYMWSDRHPYQVVEVIDQKHVYVKPMKHKLVGEPYTNNWELSLYEEAPPRLLTKWGKYWYWTRRNNLNHIFRERANVSFGVAEYYYDYER